MGPTGPYLRSKMQVLLWAIGDTPQGGEVVITDDSCLWNSGGESLALGHT
jgi:hypothetical protein